MSCAKMALKLVYLLDIKTYIISLYINVLYIKQIRPNKNKSHLLSFAQRSV